MSFTNRQEAGRRLVEVLEKYRGQPDAVVIALPRGGVVVGAVIAQELDLPLDIVVPRKIGFPGQEEYAIGAVTETGEVVWNEVERGRVSDQYARETTAREQAESRRRLKTYRGERPARDLENKAVILVDDGVATGYTMRAAIKTVRAEGAKKIVLAVPLAPGDTVKQLKKDVDEMVVLEQPLMFWAIGAHYREFPQVSDEEVAALMKAKQSEHNK